MITINDKEIKKLERDLKRFADKAFPFATKAALNATAFEARKIAQGTIKRTMTLRNRWTEGSVRVEQTRSLDVQKQRSLVGSTAEYMKWQEEGHTINARGKHGVPITTGYAAGQKGRQPRTRVARKANQMRNIKLTRTAVGANIKQRTTRAVQGAISRGLRYVYLDMRKTKGIFKVTGGKKGVNHGWPKGAKVRMVQNLSKRRVVIQGRPWLEPSARKAADKMPLLYKEALLFQIKRHGLFDNR